MTAPTTVVQSRKGHQSTLGWRICTFLLAKAQPHSTGNATATEVWRAYLAWCHDTGAIPLLLPVFLEELDQIGPQVGLARIQQGAHVVYVGMIIGEHDAVPD